MNNDLINGIFECIGGILIWFNLVKLFKDKEIKGIYLPVSLFFTIWSIWNLYYYPCLNQWFSFLGAISLATGNCFWFVLAVYFSKFKKI